MKAIFCRRATFGSLLLRTGLWSSWSHCAIVTPENTVIEAAAGKGVVEVNFAEFIAPLSRWSIKDLPVPDEAAAIRWARSQKGKPYDWAGAIGLGFHREWNDPDKWWCSEIIAGACEAGGRPRFIFNVNRITPPHVWMAA